MFISEETRELYINKVNKLLEESDFFRYACETEANYRFWWDKAPHNMLMSDYLFYNGETKGVVVFTGDTDYIVKISLKESAGDMDYCRCEWRNSVLLERAGLGYLIAKMDLLTVLPCGRAIYIQEYAECDEDTADSTVTEVAREIYCAREGITELDEEGENRFWDIYTDTDPDEMVMDLFYKLYDGKDMARFISIASDNHITDLHTGNIGIRNGNWVFVDYSGYGWIRSMEDEEWFTEVLG